VHLDAGLRKNGILPAQLKGISVKQRVEYTGGDRQAACKGKPALHNYWKFPLGFADITVICWMSKGKGTSWSTGSGMKKDGEGMGEGGRWTCPSSRTIEMGPTGGGSSY